jgi:hypothetical protein
MRQERTKINSVPGHLIVYREKAAKEKNQFMQAMHGIDTEIGHRKKRNGAEIKSEQ